MEKIKILIMLPIFMIGALLTQGQENPFFHEYDTPFGVPPFGQIDDEHFLPAFREGIKLQQQAVDRIVANQASPDFSNTVEALEYSSDLLTKVSGVFFNYNLSNISDRIQEIAQEVSPILSNHNDNILLNAELFRKINTVYENRHNEGLDAEQMRLLEETHKSFVRNGALLPDDKKERLREINEELSLLTLQFGQNVLAEVNNYRLIVEDEENLAGLPEPVIEAAAALAESEGMEGKWAFTLNNPSVMPFLQNADNRELRREIQQAYVNRGDNGNEYDNNEIILKIINLRLERAELLDFDHHAQFILEDNMAKNIESVYDFIDQVWEPARELALEEAEQLQQQIYAEGHDFDLRQWDWRYYVEKIRQEKYDIDEEQVRQYFELNTVRDGAFMVAQRLWGLQFKERNDLPKYHPDVQVFEATEADGTHIGILYLDFFPRENKRGGAWMSSFRNQHITQDGEYIHPVITMNGNFTPPGTHLPSLLTFDEMLTLFHEFGHALHGLLSDVKYHSLSGTSVPRDFVELPSQIMENWAREPEVLALFAKHYKTGESIPRELVDKIIEATNFNQGFETVEFLASTYLDLEYHTLENNFQEEGNEKVAEVIEHRTRERINLLPEIHYRHASTHFNHIFSGGYSAGYYSYMWSGLLDADAFEAFRETGDFFDAEVARSFRENILQKGGTGDAMRMYITFRGQEPKIEPLLRQRGLLR